MIRLASITSSLKFYSTQAYFKDVGVGVRPMGMGGLTQQLQTCNAVMWNSAGLAQIKNRGNTGLYSLIYWIN